MATSSLQGQQIQSLIQDRIEDWRRRLIDLSFRNRLINYRPTKSSTLQVESPSIHDLLADPERREPFDFFIPPQAQEEGDLQSQPRTEPKAGEIVTGLDDPERLEKVLSNLARKSNAEFEDKAIRVLYLAVGFLHWEDVARREQLRSPLILVPAELRRESPRDPYRLYFVDDEEIVINPALTVKLEKDVGLDIPEDWAWEDQPLAKELDEIREAIAGQGWKVVESAVLGLFSFQKLVMYRDLLRNEERVRAHPLIRALASGGAEHDLSDGFQGVPAEDELDSVQDPRTTFSILDADASQRRCIEAAKQGKSFVMQGPPGTGKSQTIANIIAEALGQGKRVLFISEKIAALDVVHKRLARTGLSDFCLKLHGRDAARKEVIESLHRSLTGMDRPRQVMSEREFDQLMDLRERLNTAVELLHRPSEVLLDMTPREVYAELAPLDGAPVVAEAAPASTRVGAEARRELTDLLRLFESLTHHWDLVCRHDFLWRGFSATSFDETARSRLLSRLENLDNASRELQVKTERVASDLGVDWTISLKSARRLERVIELLERSPAIDPAWLRGGALQRLRKAVTSARDVYGSLEKARHSFAATYPHRQASEFPANVENRMTEALAGLNGVIGRSSTWETELLGRLPEIAEFAAEVDSTFDELEKYAKQLFDALGQPWKNPTLVDIEEIKELANLAFQALDRPDRRWLIPAGRDKVRSTLEQSRALFGEYQKGLDQLRDTYAEEALGLDAESMLNRTTVAENKFLGKLSGPYRADVKTLRALRKDGKAPDDPADDLREILRLATLGARIDAGQRDYEAAFGSWYKGRETDVDAITRALGIAEAALASIAPDTDLDVLERRLCAGSQPDTQLAQNAAQVGALLNRIGASLEHIESLAARPGLASLKGRTLTSLRSLLGELRSPVVSLRQLVEVLRQGRVDGSISLSQLEQDARQISDLRRAEAEAAANAEEWGAVIGSGFRGGDTEWERVERAADWLERLFDTFETDLPSAIEEKLRSGSRTWPDLARFRASLGAFDDAVGQLTEEFDPDRASQLRKEFADSATPDVRGLVSQMRDRVDELTAWTDFRRLGEEIGRQGWGRFLELLVAESVTSDQVVPAFQKAYWNSRLDRLFDQVPELKEFRGHSHERLIANFSELDRKLVAAASDRIISVCNARRPTPVSVPGSEVALLKREAGKKRRHLPVRKLLMKLPSLLPALKPCMMMSPLTVSHYLSSDHQFDLVVFDEASQVPPWDAINCIYRAKQVIVVGDSKQLPPTPFFQQVDPEAEGFDEEAEQSEEVMESILDACEALLPAESLRWHYRSRHEHLISFSNHHFYDNRLVTFPAPVLSAGDLGVHLIYVPDGVYDRARSRTNRVEARRVAERVIEHLRAKPERTIGVVAFSVAQAEAINDELDALRSANPDLERHFAADRLDAVFVKNLESVQGDERDVVVFSVGYGYDEHGKFYQGFGPLNKDGGHRRLNVAVTRAREQIDVVTSVRASDFDLSETAKPGAQRLRDYLEFAENGPKALRREIEAMGGEYESPFEESVGEAVRELGYEAIPQVGVGGFRIDLGVVDPVSPGRFALGIECDGATYHSTPTARDRDRLRQQILEGLGWRIHRIWSWDWVRERRKETNRLKEAIQQALNSDDPPMEDPTATGASDGEMQRDREVIEVYEFSGSEDAANLPWAIRYECADLSGFRSAFEFHEPESRPQLRQALESLLAVEAPISTDRTIKSLAASQGISRRGSRVVQAARLTIKEGIASGFAERRGDFLWTPGQVIDAVRIPDPDNPDTQRSIDEIPPEELDLALTKLQEAGGISDADALIAQTARIFGFNRTGHAIREQLMARLDALNLR